MLLTPPPTDVKFGIFTKMPSQMPYYEDIYGKRNGDETLEGAAVQCETESETDEDEDEDEDEPPSPIKGRYSGGTKKNHHRYRIAPRFNSGSLITANNVDKLESNSNKIGVFSRVADLLEDALPRSKVVDGTIADDEPEGVKESKTGQEKSGVASKEAEDKARIQRGRIRRPATRALINQQLKEKAMADKKAAEGAARLEKKRRTRELGVKKANGKGVAGATTTTSSKKLAASRRGRTGLKCWTKAEAKRMPTAYVVIDHSGINFEEYQRV